MPYVSARFSVASARSGRAKGASPLQKDDDVEGFGGGGDDDTGNSEPSADAETPREAPGLSSGLSGATQGSSKRKRKAKKRAQKDKKAKAVRTFPRRCCRVHRSRPHRRQWQRRQRRQRRRRQGRWQTTMTVTGNDETPASEARRASGSSLTTGTTSPRPSKRKPRRGSLRRTSVTHRKVASIRSCHRRSALLVALAAATSSLAHSRLLSGLHPATRRLVVAVSRWTGVQRARCCGSCQATPAVLATRSRTCWTAPTSPLPAPQQNVAQTR